MRYASAMLSARPAPVLRLALLLLLAGVLAGSSCVWKFSSGSGDDDDRDPDDDGGGIIIIEDATFGGWDLARALAGRPGVLAVKRGWTGGSLPFLGAGWTSWTGHVRAVRVRFDASVTPFEELVRVARVERADAPRLTVYAHDDGQEQAARSVFPADSLPRLRLRSAGRFIARD
jgi:hypothetical protein